MYILYIIYYNIYYNVSININKKDMNIHITKIITLQKLNINIKIIIKMYLHIQSPILMSNPK